MLSRILAGCSVALLAAALTSPAPLAPTPAPHVQGDPDFLAFEAEAPQIVTSADGSARHYVRVPAGAVGNASGGSAVVPSAAEAPVLGYRLVFQRAGSYHLHFRFSLLTLDGEDPEQPDSYRDDNSFYLPHALNVVPGGRPDRDPLTSERENVFHDSMWPFPHAGRYAWNTTESIVFHNWALFPVHRIEVGEPMLGEPQTLYVRAREKGFALDAFALVHAAALPACGEQEPDPLYDLHAPEHGVPPVAHDLDGDGAADAYDFVGDGTLDAGVIRFGRYFGVEVFALDRGDPTSPLPAARPDGNPDTHFDLDGDGRPDFHTHFAGRDPDGGATPGQLDALLGVGSGPATRCPDAAGAQPGRGAGGGPSRALASPAHGRGQALGSPRTP